MSALTIGSLCADELGTLADWAAQESWNPGLHDVETAWAVDPDAFVAARRDGELVGAGSIVSYGGRFGFMGLFIVRPDLRGEGIGRVLWHHRRDLLLSRLLPGASIGMDGVFTMVRFYERGGFRLAHRDLRFEGVARGNHSQRVIDLREIDFDLTERFDRMFVAAPRAAFLRAWLSQATAVGGAIVGGAGIEAYGMLRQCRVGYKIGPLFGSTRRAAEEVLDHLLAQVEGFPVQIDVPEPNTRALEIVAQRGLHESFGCARMYLGEPPRLPLDGIFGVTSFEFG